ncbi:DUF6932 family protein [Streptomyces venezuelae]|nr:hypothetical protein [Streptomyces venezuelae]
MGVLPDLDPKTGLLPPGRYPASLSHLERAYVSAPGFADSSTRRHLWEEWQCHRAIVEAETGDIARTWLGGSFVSAKLDPGDIDVTYLLHSHVYDALDRDSLVSLDDLTDRSWCVERGMRIDAT